ncbi:MAG TPA: response regulator [Syntrophorhabdales bacterium]|nr:response regulator [Syntrophorhabdales bacterium]
MSGSILDQRKILAVDDEKDVLDVLEEEITSSCVGCAIDKATSYAEALKLLQSGAYDLIILDIMGVRGFDLLDIAVKKNLRAVMLTAHALSPENLKRAYDTGARAYLPKERLKDIVPFLEDALKYDFESGWKRSYEALRDTFTTLWGRDWDKLEKVTGVKLPPGWSGN